MHCGTNLGLWVVAGSLPRVRTVEGIDVHFLCWQRRRQDLTLLCFPFCLDAASLLAAVWSIQQIASQLSSSQARAKARHRDGLCHLPSLSVVFSQYVLQALPQHGDSPEPCQASPPHRLPQRDQAGPWKAAKSTKGSRGRKEREARRFSHPPSPPPPPPPMGLHMAPPSAPLHYGESTFH